MTGRLEFVKVNSRRDGRPGAGRSAWGCRSAERAQV